MTVSAQWANSVKRTPILWYCSSLCVWCDLNVQANKIITFMLLLGISTLLGYDHTTVSKLEHQYVSAIPIFGCMCYILEKLPLIRGTV